MFNKTRIQLAGVAAVLAVAVFATVIEFGTDSGIAGAFGKARAGESEFARSILDDGMVTDAELKLALDRAATCIEDEGIAVIRFGDPRLQGAIGYAANHDGQTELSRAREVAGRCDREFAREVQLAYSGQFGRDPALSEQLMLSCLQAKGVNIERAPHGEEIGKLAADPATKDAFFSCAENPTQKGP
jgi:hypothetical protein